MRYMRDGRFPAPDWTKLGTAAIKLKAASLHIFDNFDLDLRGIITECRKLQVKLSKDGKKIGLMILDYLQLIDGEGSEERKELEYSNTVKRCKKMSKEFACPVLGISQLNEQKKLYGARSIKYHLDGLLLIDDAEDGVPGHLDLCSVKMRNGEKGPRIPILFDSLHMNFTDREVEDEMPEPENRNGRHINRVWVPE